MDNYLQTVLQRCAFFLDPNILPAALAAGLDAMMGQQVNALGPQTKKFATLQQGAAFRRQRAGTGQGTRRSFDFRACVHRRS